jgi:hypothetical protein
MTDDQGRKKTGRATLSIGGQRIPMNRFVEGALVGIVEGFLSALREVPPGEVVLTIPADRRATEQGASSPE